MAVSLQKQCLVYIACRLEYFPPKTLALLPPYMQMEVVRSLPVADVCALEGTVLAKTIDFDSIWKKVCMSHPIPHTFPEEHFRDMIGFESMKDYFFTFVWHLAMIEQVPVIHRIRTRRQVVQNNWQNVQTRGMVLDSIASLEGYQNFCSILISLRSAADIDSYDSIFQSVLQLPSVLKEPYIPRRYMKYYEQMRPPHSWSQPSFHRHRSTMTLTERAAHSATVCNVGSLILNTCNYRPRALQLKTYDFLRTQLWTRNELEDVASIFREVRYMLLIMKPEFSKEGVEDCISFIKGVLPTALRTLEKLRIRFEDAMALNLFLPKIYNVIANWVSNEITNMHSLALSVDTLTPGHDIMSDQSENLLLKFTEFFSASHFHSLILEGMHFRGEVIVPKIITSFLNKPCRGKQRLVLSRIQFEYCGLTAFPHFYLPACAHLHKELKFNTMTLQPRIFEKLLSKPGFKLHLLEVLLEKWHHNVPPECVSLVTSMHNKLPLDLCCLNPTLHISCLRFHIHLVSYPGMKENLQSLFHLKTLQSLDLSCCNIGPGGVTTALTHGLKAYQTIELGSLRSLNLSKNGLGVAEEKRLESFFSALFGLPKLPQMTIDLSHNDFNSRHFMIMYGHFHGHCNFGLLPFFLTRLCNHTQFPSFNFLIFIRWS